MTIREILIGALSNSEVSEIAKSSAVSAPTTRLKPSLESKVVYRFDAPKFIVEWFRKKGFAYFFLFKKNLSVTNIQFAELLALIRRFTTSTDGEIVHDLQFSTVADFNRSVKNMVEAFPRDPLRPKSRFATVADLYLPLFRRTLVITNFFGSSAVFIPPGLALDLRTLCGYAGYIHSCGHNVYIRNAYKATKEEFFKSLNKHVNRFLRKDKHTFFTVYAHEDFTKHDRNQESELRHGLDDVKVFIEKFYMGSDPLVAVIDKMRKRYKDRLKIPDPGDFRKVHKKLRADKTIDRERTLWLIVDHEIGPSSRHPSETFYFICYDQLWSNDNPFHMFDENKPAWVNHTTIPHTLMGAMLNITAPWWPKAEEAALVIGDPFVGTGTTWLEGLKYEFAQFDCGDNDDIAPVMAKDNLAFFSSSVSELRKLSRLLRETKKDFSTAPEPHLSGTTQTSYQEAYLWAQKMYTMLNPSRSVDSYSFTPGLISDLTTECRGLEHRLLFYLCLRTGLRHREGLWGRGERWKDAYLKELSTLQSQIHHLLDLRKKERRGVHQTGLCAFEGDYSRACSISVKLLASRSNQGGTPVSVRDARKPSGIKFDVIITDPPYGFNTEGDPRDLSDLYSVVINVMMASLKDEGQLVIALPDWSHTGRQVPFFAHKEIVTNQVLIAAEREKREVISGAYMTPAPGNIFRPPYYWESERALRRAILHFRTRTLCPPAQSGSKNTEHNVKQLTIGEQGGVDH